MGALCAHSFLCCIRFCRCKPQSPEPASLQALSQLLDRFAKAQQTFDVATLAELTTENYIEVSPRGEVAPRDKMLSFYAPQHTVDAPTMSIEEKQVRVFGETGVILAKLTYTMKGMDNQVHTFALQGTFVASKTSSGWKLVSSSFTPVNTPKTKQRLR